MGIPGGLLISRAVKGKISLVFHISIFSFDK